MGGERLRAVVLGLLVALVLAEVGARVLHTAGAEPEASARPVPPGMVVADEATGFALAPGFSDPRLGFTVNARGFRDRERAPGPAAPGTLRIALAGDSFAAGASVADDEHLAFLLEEALRPAPGPRVEVWNLGVPHTGPEQTLHRLRARWDDVQPDVVVFAFFEGNDPWDDAVGPGVLRVRDGELVRVPWAPTAGSPYNDRRAEIARPIQAHHLPGDRLLQRHSYAYRRALHAVAALRADRPADGWPWGMQPFDYEAFGGMAWLMLDPEPPPIAQAWSITADVLEAMKAAVSARGARLLLVSIPPRVAIDAEARDVAAQVGWRVGPDPNRRLDPTLPLRRLRAIADDLDVPLLDLRDALLGVGSAAYFADDSHWTAAGHRAAAGAVARFLADHDVLGRSDVARVDDRLVRLVPDGSVRRVLEPSRGFDVIPERYADPAALAGLLRDALPEGFTAGRARWSVGPLDPPDWPVVVARAELDVSGPDCEARLTLVDGAGDPEVDEWRRRQREFVAGAVESGVPSSARLSLTRSHPCVPVSGFVAPLGALGRELVGASAGLVRPTVVVGTDWPGAADGPSSDLRAHLVEPASLATAMPVAPDGWQVLDALPMYRPHDVPDEPALPADVEAALAALQAPPGASDVPWTAQLRRWYRGPFGSFALVVQDTGRDTRLLRSREARLARAATPEPSPPADAPTLAPFDAGPRGGFRTCLDAQGLCKVVVPLTDDPAARYNAILMGPASAPDEGYAALLSAIEVDALQAD